MYTEKFFLLSSYCQYFMEIQIMQIISSHVHEHCSGAQRNVMTEIYVCLAWNIQKKNLPIYIYSGCHRGLQLCAYFIGRW